MSGLGRRWKKTREAGGVVVFADEVGFLMNPCVKATWSPVGQTPVVPFRNRNHRRISALGAIALAADDAIRTLADWHFDTCVRGPQAAEFVERLLKEFLDRPITLVWDRLQARQSNAVKALAALHPCPSIEHLPAYAPDLNPVEGLWCLTKHHRMANHSLDTFGWTVERNPTPRGRGRLGTIHAPRPLQDRQAGTRAISTQRSVTHCLSATCSCEEQ